MLDDRYLATTPFGAVWISFPEEAPNVYEGDEHAIEYLHEAMRDCIGSGGVSIDPATCSPWDCYWFCQPAGSGVTVTPNSVDGAEYARLRAEKERAS